MDLSIFGQQYKKAMADAIKVGALDSKTDSFLNDMFKALSNEITRKEDTVKRTVGEIMQLKQTHQLVLSLVNNHTRVEQANIDAEADRQRLLAETNEDKEAKLKPLSSKKKAKKRVAKKPTSHTKFSGDESKQV